MAIREGDGWRGKAVATTAAALAATWLATAAHAEGVSPEVLKERRESALHVLTHEDNDAVADIRQRCASGAWSPRVVQVRARGPEDIWQETPDASDMCANALARVAKDGGLQAAYAQLVSELAGDNATARTLPAAIGAAVKASATTVSIGNQRGAKITPALALDAGFTVAYQGGSKAAAGMPDIATLKPIAERCLAQSESNLALCYATGFVYGARAVSGLPLLP
jgi:hypothetical protein